jgi:tRNA pseudouridine38-40 synthase
MKILLTLSYVGTSYCGYQLQPDKPTVAAELNKATEKAFGFKCNVTGCSRTDSGVHALGYRATIEPCDADNKITVPLERIPVAINCHLPQDISILSAINVDEGFHPRYDVVKKEYIYKIHASEIRNPFLNGRVMELGKNISTLDVEGMKAAAREFVGEYNFDAFMATGSKITDTCRHIFESEIEIFNDTIQYRVCANGFLYNMVRIIVGTLIDVGKGKISPCDIKKIILSRDRKNAGPTAKADGLYLNKVIYGFDS